MANEQHMVFCKKLQRELPGLETPPWPGELGQRIYDNISADAWKMWEERMKMILNEYRRRRLRRSSASRWRISSSAKERRSRRGTSHRRGNSE